MGPPNQLTSPSSKNDKGSHRDPSRHPQSRPVEKTSLELLLESTERTPPFADAPQFGLLRDSLVFNHERMLQQSPPFTPEGTQVLPPRPATQPHYPSLNTIHSQTNNYLEETSPIFLPTEEESITPPKFPPLSDRTAQNRANANLDRHVGWQLNQSQQTPPGQRGRGGNDFQSSLLRTHLSHDIPGDIPLTNTAASLHLPSPPTSELFSGLEPPSATTVTTVYAYKCNRAGRHAGDDDSLPPRDNYSNPIYEERTLESPFLYSSAGAQHHQHMTLDHVTPEGRESEEEMEVNSQQEDNGVPDIEPKLNSTNMQTVPTLAVGDYATDEDFDDDLITTTNTQQQPFFPNPADLKWPDPTYLKLTLDPKYHPFIEQDYKKDCRSWLWKNEKGRRARQILEGGKLISNSSVTCHQRVPVSADNVISTKRAFSDNNDDLEDDNEMMVSLQQ